MVDSFYVTKNGMTVDPARLKRNGETLMFTPFVVEDSLALTEALDRQQLAADSEMLLAVRNRDQIIALSRQQMAYHHVAQGTIDDEPWLVFF